MGKIFIFAFQDKSAKTNLWKLTSDCPMKCFHHTIWFGDNHTTQVLTIWFDHTICIKVTWSFKNLISLWNRVFWTPGNTTNHLDLDEPCNHWMLSFLQTYSGCLKLTSVMVCTPWDCSTTWISPWDSITPRNLDNCRIDVTYNATSWSCNNHHVCKYSLDKNCDSCSRIAVVQYSF